VISAIFRSFQITLPNWGAKLHPASLALRNPPRYGHSMPEKSANLADALLRLWLLAELAMAGLYLWQGWLLWPYPGDWAAPPTRRAVTVVEGLYLFLFIPAAITVAARWAATRDRPLAILVLAYGLLTALSFAAWGFAATLGETRALFIADALISLIAVPIALRALKASA
jgi:hypothetical protein